MRETARCLWLLVITLVAAVVGATGCKVQVDKSHDGDDKQVKIATPFGGISVNKGETSPADLGLPAYPGAVLDPDHDGDKSAKVDLGFGSWKLRVRVANYASPDGRDQVMAFYRKALGRYGAVIECRENKPVGEPVSTGEGLRCDSEDHSTHQNYEHSDLQLKAGSPHHQHIVALDRGSGSATHFTLIELELPHGSSQEQEGTN